MDLALQTGTTTSGSGTVLVSRTFESHGEQVCLLLQVRSSARDAQALEDECLGIVEHALLGTEGEAWTRLDGTLKEMNGLFKGLMMGDSIADVHAVIALIERSGMMHVSHAGRGEAWLLRHGAASQITEFSRGKPVPNFIHISSGQLERGDVVVFSTQRLMRALTPAQLSRLAGMGDGIIDDLRMRLQSEKEVAALGSLQVDGGFADMDGEEEPAERSTRRRAAVIPRRGQNNGRMAAVGGVLQALGARLMPIASRVASTVTAKSGGGARGVTGSVAGGFGRVREFFATFLVDLRDPERKRRAHLLLLAGTLVVFLLIWMIIRLSIESQRNKTRQELADIIDQVAAELQTAETRRLAGDPDAANAILERSEEKVKQVIDNQSQFYRSQAVDLLAKVREKREQISNITRLNPPRILTNLSTKNADIVSAGLIGISDGEMVVYDKHASYRIISSSVNDPRGVVEQDQIAGGSYFERYQSPVFLTTGNSVIELGENQATDMKTEDPQGWHTGVAIETYGRYLYLLSPAAKQIYKYERLNGRYGAPANYNVNGDVGGGIDLAIDGSVYVLKQGGVVLKLLRGEAQNFVIRQAPKGLLQNATNIYKVSGGNFYFLDPTGRRVIVASDGGATGESQYVRQFVLEGEMIGRLQDLFVDNDETHLYVLDEKRIYVVDLKG